MGRPAKTAATTEDADAGHEPEPEAGPGQTALFPLAKKGWHHVTVNRVDPAEEKGFLGDMPLETTEHDLRARFGGGKYIVQARTEGSQIMMTRTVDIAGDPIFISQVAEQRWRRGLGQRTSEPAAAAQIAAAAPQGLGLGEMMTLITTLQSAQQQQMENFQRMQAEERARRDEDRRREDEARRREDDAREERRRKDYDEARARDREHMAGMLQLITATTAAKAAAREPAADQTTMLEVFTKGMEMATKLRPPGGGGGGGGEGGAADDDGEEEDQDPTSTAIQAGVRGLIDSLTGRAAPPPAPAAAPVDEDGVRVTGALGEQLKDFVNKAQSSGRDPNAVLSNALAVIEKNVLSKPAAAHAAPSSTPVAPAPAALPPTSMDARRAAAEKVRAAIESKRNGTAHAAPSA